MEPWPLGGLLDAKASRGSLGGVLGLLFGVLGLLFGVLGRSRGVLGEALEASWVYVGALKDAWSSQGVLLGAYGGLWGGFGSRWVAKWPPFGGLFREIFLCFFGSFLRPHFEPVLWLLWLHSGGRF